MTPPPPSATEESRLLVERHGAVLQLTLSHPARRNVLHPDMYAAGLAALRTASDDPSLGAVVLTGAGAHFCAGGNLQRLAANRAGPPERQREGIEQLHAWVRALRACPLPVIAAIEGSAAGAGFSLALACDLIVAADSARFSMAYVRIGLSPDGGGSAFCASLLPRQLANELLLTGDAIDSQRLHALGVVNQRVPDGEALAAAHRLAARLAQGPRLAQGRIKRLIDQAPHTPLPVQLDLERESFVDSLFGPEAGEGIAAFLDKRPADFHRNTP